MADIVGMACRLPGGINDKWAYWEALEKKKILISEPSSDRFIAEETAALPRKFKAGFLDSIKHFDNAFFRISSKEALVMDPQQRLALEVVQEAIEDTGLDPETLRGSRTGVYAGCEVMEYGNQQGRLGLPVQTHSAAGSALSAVSNRISFAFDFVGPSMTIATACSSSMMALHVAVSAIKAGECEVAVVVGANACSDWGTFVAFDAGGFLSQVSESRPFDESATGFVRAEAFCALVLQRKSGPRTFHFAAPYASIPFTMANEDGNTPSLTMPSHERQVELMEGIYGNVDKSKVVYVEAHGTGTPVGDPIEAHSIGVTFADTGKEIKIGSVKGNLGHTEPAAGAVSVAKVALMMHKATLVPSGGFEKLNPRIASFNMQLQIQQKVEKLNMVPGDDYYMGANSSGFGGANAHCIVQKFWHSQHTYEWLDKGDSQGSSVIFVPLWSHFAAGLDQLQKDWLRLPGKYLAGLAQVQRGRKPLVNRPHYRRVLLIQSEKHGSSQDNTHDLLQAVNGGAKALPPTIEPKRVAFVFSGQGSQSSEMAIDAVANLPGFKEALDRFDQAYSQVSGGLSLVKGFGLGLQPIPEEKLVETTVAVPCIVAVQVALTMTLRSFGIEASITMGHSMGEMTAAWASGRLTLLQLAALTHLRGTAQADMSSEGRMAALGCSLEDFETHRQSLSPENRNDIVVSAHNAPKMLTVSGTQDAVKEMQSLAEKSNCFFRILAVEHAYHSDQVDSVKQQMERGLAAYENQYGVSTPDGLREGDFTAMSSSTSGKLLEATDPIRPSHWWLNMRNPVLFEEACGHLNADLIIEIGARSVLRSYLNRNNKKTIITSIGSDTQKFWFGLATCFVSGMPMSFEPLDTLEVPSFAHHLMPKMAWNHAKEVWFDTSVRARPRMGVASPGPKSLDTESDLYEERLGQVTLTRARYGHYIFDHIIDGSSVLPGSLYASLALEMQASMAVQGLRTENFVGWTKNMEKKQLGFQFDGTSFTFINNGATAACGRLAPMQEIPPLCSEGLQAIKEKCQALVEPALMYRFFKEFAPPGFGITFQSLQEGFLGGNDILAKLPSPPDGQHSIHPIVLDGAFQSILLRVGITAEGYIPDEMRHLQFEKGVKRLPMAPVYVHTRVKHLDMTSTTSDIDLYSESGQRLFIVRDYRAVRMARSLVDFPRLYNVAWTPLPTISTDGLFQASDMMTAISDLLSTLNDDLESVMDGGDPVVRLLCLEPEQPSDEHQKALVKQIEKVTCLPWTLTVIGKAMKHSRLCGVDSVGKLPRHSFTVVLCKSTQDANDYVAVGGAALPSDSLNPVFGNELRGEKVLIHLAGNCDMPWLEESIVDVNDAELVVCRPRHMLQLAGILKGLDSSSPSVALVCLVSKRDVHHDAILGFCRSARNESPTRRRIYFLRIDGSDVSKPPLQLQEPLLQVLGRLPDDDFDLMLRSSGRLCSLRIHPMDFEAQGGNGREVRLRVKIPGQLRSLALERFDAEAEEVHPHEVRVKVLHSAINFKDVLLAMDMIPKMSSAALGNECIGRITHVGSSPQTQERLEQLGVKLGDLVVCLGGGGREPRCGMLSTSTVCSVNQVFPIPKANKLPLHELAGVPIVVCTAYYALVELAKVQAGEVVLIHSAMGGLGQAALKLARRLGAKVIASAGSTAKRDALSSMDCVLSAIDSRDPHSFRKAVYEATNGRGVDVVLNSLAGSGITESLACCAPGGRFVEVGKRDANGGRTAIPVNMLAQNITFFAAHLDFLGHFFPDRFSALVEKVLGAVAREELDPVETHAVPLAEAKEAFQVMSRGQHTGKIVVSMPENGIEGLLDDIAVEEKNVNLVVRPEDLSFSLLPRGVAPFPVHLTMLMTGCAGGLGIFFAMAAARAGSKHLCLTTTRDPETIQTVEFESAKQIWKEMGCEVKVVQIDLSDSEAVDKLVKATTPPIGTVIHLANSYVDGPATEITEDGVSRALGSKAISAWNLHESTMKHCSELEGFLMASSVSGLYGNLYQSVYAGANAALEELAVLRRDMGLPAVTLDLPCVLGSGRISQVTHLREVFWNSSRGFGIVSEIFVWFCLMEALHRDRHGTCSPHLLLDNTTFAPYLEWSRNKLSFHHLCLDQAHSSTRVKGLERASLEHELADRVEDLLGCDREDLSNSDTILADLGMDSLASVELSNWLRARTGVHVSQTEILTTASFRSLLDTIFNEEDDDQMPVNAEKGTDVPNTKEGSTTVEEISDDDELSKRVMVGSLDKKPEKLELSDTESSKSSSVTPVQGGP